MWPGTIRARGGQGAVSRRIDHDIRPANALDEEPVALGDDVADGSAIEFRTRGDVQLVQANADPHKFTLQVEIADHRGEEFSLLPGDELGHAGVRPLRPRPQTMARPLSSAMPCRAGAVGGAIGFAFDDR
jgi:hypothetical protein